jgi:hypothetical protein
VLRGVTKVLAMVALVLLVSAGGVAAADAPSEAAIVIKLPPSMTPAEVKQLVGDLQAKGATLAPATASPATRTAQPLRPPA